MKTLTPPLKHFASLQALADYVSEELIATLDTDLLKMATSERPQYSNDDRKEMRQRVRDVKLFGKYIHALPALIRACHQFCACIDSTGGVVTDPKGHRVPNADPDWIDLGEAYSQTKITLLTITRQIPRAARIKSRRPQQPS